MVFRHRVGHLAAGDTSEGINGGLECLKGTVTGILEAVD